MKCLESVSIHSMHFCGMLMRNVNEKKENFKRMGNVTDVFRAHFMERLERVRGVWIFKTRVNGKSMKC